MRPSLASRIARRPGAIALGLIMFISGSVQAQQSPEASAGPQTNSSVIDAQGTAHVTRVVPVPTTVSPQAQEMLRRSSSEGGPPSLAQRRAGTDAWQSRAGERSRQLYPAKVNLTTIAGVPVREVTPLDASPMHPDRVLINVHGGGFDSDSGSLTESIPIANLTHTRVVAVLYRLAPEHPFPAAVDDTIAVYKELLKSYKPAHIALYGTSAGAILTAEVAVRMKQLGLPLPGALGIFSGLGDFIRSGDSQAMYSLRGLSGSLPLPADQSHASEYVTSTDRKDPVLSPVYADLHGMPPTLFITSGRDSLLSGTIILHRAFLTSGVDARLIVFEALPHAFWNDVDLPESKEAYGNMSDFFNEQLGR
jgi:epsilon-lactone hydrolase